MRMYITIGSAIIAAGLLFGGAKASAASYTNQASLDKVTVQPGDTLSAIATSHQTTYVRLYDANQQITDPDIIFPAETIRIPAPDEQLPNRPLSDSIASTSTSSSPNQPTQVSSPAPAVTSSAASGTWQSLAECESGGNWSDNTGNGYYGGLQFSQSSWQAVGGTGTPDQASPAEQIARAQALLAREGWGAWPACSAKLGL